jgi:LPXTG-site transpeptidase (sortase) family protein
MLVRHNKSSRQILLQIILSVIAVVLLISAIVFAVSLATKQVARSDSASFSDNVLTATVNKQITADIGLPIRLKIPSINVDAEIYYVGLTSDGKMDIKSDPTQVAWYEYGPRPGEKGSAVIAGHYGWLDGKGSVFNDLHTLGKGDEIIITDSKGSSITFVVRESQKFDPDVDTSSIFHSNDGKIHLNLITCDGTWISFKNSYSDRLVIFTDKK